MTAAASLGAGVASADAPNDTTTVTYHGDPIPTLWTATMPRLGCPAAYPYVLDQQYNDGTGFRLGPGIEFTDWSWGFDANVNYNYLTQPVSNGYVRIGLNGDNHSANNTATYWGTNPPKTNWTLNLHCTSDLSKASIQDYP